MLAIIWNIVKIGLLLGLFMGVLAASDWIVGAVIRVFPAIGEWLDSLPLSK